VHSLKENNDLYNQLGFNLDDDLQQATFDITFETLRWIFPNLLPNLRPVTPKILKLLL
jgi:hypothetical protein